MVLQDGPGVCLRSGVKRKLGRGLGSRRGIWEGLGRMGIWEGVCLRGSGRESGGVQGPGRSGSKGQRVQGGFRVWHLHIQTS